MKTPTLDLIEEHGGIMLMLSIMSKVSEKLNAGDEVKKEDLNKILEFLINFADKCHHGKEEDMLFPELAKNPVNLEFVSELIKEHKTGREYIKNISAAFENYGQENSAAREMAENMEKYVQLLTKHIAKENGEPFPIANKELSNDTQKQMVEQFEKFEEDVIGAGKHEEYHKWLEELKKNYLD